MSNQKFEVTNPEAIKLISDLKSGHIFQPFLNVLKKYKWLLIGGFTLIALFIAIAIGKQLSRISTPVYAPPIIEDVTPTITKRVRSSFDALKLSVVNFSSTLPDPALPLMDNQISLEQSLIQ
jgi:hypothetical protein